MALSTRGQNSSTRGLRVERVFTHQGVHPYAEVKWEQTDVIIKNFRDDSINFSQLGVEFPAFWSLNARQIVTSKYFRGKQSAPDREWSLKQVIDRVANKYADEGIRNGYFADEESGEVFRDELKYMLLHQMFAFNSPVWFNVGTNNDNNQVSACFLLSVEDDMEAILHWYKEEGMIFRGGSGAGVNLSRLRGSHELLASGGMASGPVSFMRGADASAGTIQSGGANRRAAKLVCLDVDHPDIEQFVGIKAREELKIKALRDAGFDMDMGGEDSSSVQYQNANNSVRVSDEFMHAVEADAEFALRNRVDGEIAKTVQARALFEQMAQAAWECADPGIQYDDTINSWHTNPESGRIETSNPCLRRGTQLLTSDGPRPIEDLVDVAELKLWDGDGYVPGEVWWTGNKDLVRLTVSDGRTVDVTPDHRILTSDGWEEARECQGLIIPPADNWREPDFDLWPWVESVEALSDSDDVYDFRVPTTSMGSANGILIHNCSEYMSLSNSSCNLASLNLMKFFSPVTGFDSDLFVKAVELVITAMDISICFADFPTEKIAEGSRSFRQLGIGYSNLGAMLMASGRAYDSEGGRAFAASVTSLMSAVSYRRSVELAGFVGPYEGFSRNRDAHLSVLARHARANSDAGSVHSLDQGIFDLAQVNWDLSLHLGSEFGIRNAQISLLAPTGTISFMMDCDTTGIEPDFALTKYKKMHGGASMQIVNQTVPLALRTLGYHSEQIEAVVGYIRDHGHVVDAPSLREEHYEVFDCAIGELRYIEPRGHILMMAAVQPFLSGAISKTVNLPEDSTVADIAAVYLEGWKLGLKSVAVYRDNCKAAQPLSSGGSAQPKAEVVVDVGPDVVESPHAVLPVRHRLPARRPSLTTSFSIGGAEGYLTSSSYPGNGIGEIFLKLGKQGSTLAGVMDAFSIAVSIGLQYGIPLGTYVEKFIGMQFEPRGMTNDADVRLATSVLDYVFRRLAMDYLTPDQRSVLGISSVSERAEALSPVAEEVLSDHPAVIPSSAGFVMEAPLCSSCGTSMQRSGSCYACSSCGVTSGCS